MQIKEVSISIPSSLVDADHRLGQLRIVAEVQFQLPGRQEGEQGHGSHLEGSETATWTLQDPLSALWGEHGAGLVVWMTMPNRWLMKAPTSDMPAPKCS